MHLVYQIIWCEIYCYWYRFVILKMKLKCEFCFRFLVCFLIFLFLVVFQAFMNWFHHPCNTTWQGFQNYILYLWWWTSSYKGFCAFLGSSPRMVIYGVYLELTVFSLLSDFHGVSLFYYPYLFCRSLRIQSVIPIFPKVFSWRMFYIQI